MHLSLLCLFVVVSQSLALPSSKSRRAQELLYPKEDSPGSNDPCDPGQMCADVDGAENVMVIRCQCQPGMCTNCIHHGDESPDYIECYCEDL